MIIKKYDLWKKVSENKEEIDNNITLSELNSDMEDKSMDIKIQLSKAVPDLDISKMKTKEYVDKIQYILNNAYNIVEFEDGSANLLMNSWGDDDKKIEEYDSLQDAIQAIINKEKNA